jgi:aquaporin Z
MRKYIVEFIGTFFLVLTVGACVDNPSPGVIAPVAIGGSLMIMIFAGGYISGAHYNPAVTLAVTIRGRLPALEAPWYWLAQLLGAVGAAVIVFCLKGANQAVAAPAPAYQLGQCALAEFLFTFALAYVVLHVATAKGTSGNSFYGLAIGSTVMVGAFAVGPISGGVFNPAVATGVLCLGLLPAVKYFVYVAVQLIAGIIAGLIFRTLNPEDK